MRWNGIKGGEATLWELVFRGENLAFIEARIFRLDKLNNKMLELAAQIIFILHPISIKNYTK